MFTTSNSLAVHEFCTTAADQFVTCAMNEQFSDNDFLTLDEPDSVTISVFDPPIKTEFITDLNEEGYTLLRSIPVDIEREADGHAVASFREANIAIGGTSDHDAFQSLFAEVLDTFDDLIDAEEHLGPDALHQLEVLRTYIVKA